jgi:hypothetical protein
MMRRIGKRKWRMLDACHLSLVMLEVDCNQRSIHLTSHSDSPAILRSRGNGTSGSLTSS